MNLGTQGLFVSPYNVSITFNNRIIIRRQGITFFRSLPFRYFNCFFTLSSILLYYIRTFITISYLLFLFFVIIIIMYIYLLLLKLLPSYCYSVVKYRSFVSVNSENSCVPLRQHILNIILSSFTQPRWCNIYILYLYINSYFICFFFILWSPLKQRIYTSFVIR